MKMIKNSSLKDNYINEMKSFLSNLPSEEREDILYDYEEHFQMGLEEGKTEEEIIDALGNPKTIAKQYNASYMINKAEDTTSTSNVLGAIFAAVSLGFFNLIFVLGPFLGVVGVLIGLFAAALGVIIGGAALFIGAIFGPAFPAYIDLPTVMSSNVLATVFLSFGLTSLGILFFIGCCYLAKFISVLTLKYLKLNLKVIQR